MQSTMLMGLKTDTTANIPKAAAVPEMVLAQFTSPIATKTPAPVTNTSHQSEYVTIIRYVNSHTESDTISDPVRHKTQEWNQNETCVF